MDEIDKIDWAGLTHAYGAATDVPNLLAALASGDASDWNNAMYALYGSLCHQGTVYSATVAATPMLVDLALDPETFDQTQLIIYLGALIADFGGEPPNVEEFDLPDSIDRDELAAELGKHHRYVGEIGEVIRARADDFRVLWDGDDVDLAIASAALLTFLGDEEASAKLAELEAARPVHYAIVLPTESEYAVEIAQHAGRPELADAPFLFFDGDTSALDELIVEDPDDFLPELMADAGRIATELYEDAIAHAAPDLESFRFYAGLSADELHGVCAEQGWIRVEAPVVPSEPLELVDHEHDDDGKAWDDITAAERKLLELFVDILADAGWQETRPWHENLKSCGWNVSPQGVGRYLAADATLEVGLWLYDPIASAEVAGFVGEPHVRLVVHDDDDASLPLRFYGDLGAILGALVEQQREVTPTNYIEGLLHEMFDVCDLVLAEANGGLMKLERS